MARKEMTVEADGVPVRLSSPDKVMFPEQGWTKPDVAQHYLRCGSGVMRAIRGRPCLLKRWPQGVAGEPFYQKRAPKQARETAWIRFPSARPGRMVVARELQDVIWMVQLNCLDLHSWPVTTDDLDHPNELRLDLDPTDGTSFDMVRAVAAVCRDVLEENGLSGWPKTSGSRGIHVYAPIEPRWTFTEVRSASLALAREVERREPDRATTAWWKEERRGVFIDYNQNARDKTIASAYSVRHTGRVSAPFRWDELHTIDPQALDLETFAERWGRARRPPDGDGPGGGQPRRPAGDGGRRRAARARRRPLAPALPQAARRAATGPAIEAVAQGDAVSASLSYRPARGMPRAANSAMAAPAAARTREHVHLSSCQVTAGARGAKPPASEGRAGETAAPQARPLLEETPVDRAER